MKYLKVKIVDHTYYSKWDERITTVNEITKKYAGVELLIDIESRAFSGIEWTDWHANGRRYPKKEWIDENYSRTAQNYDVVVGNFADEHWDTDRKNNLGGSSFDDDLGVSEIMMRATDGQKRNLKKGERYSEWVVRFLHEMCHSVFDHIDHQIDTTHYWDYEQKDLSGAIRSWKCETTKGNMERGDFNIIVRPLPLNQSWAGNTPRSIVFHTLLGSIEGSYSWLDQINLSYNYMIGKDGKIYEQVPINRSAWHAGRVYGATDRALAFFKGKNPNTQSIGIAFERRGEPKLTREQVLAGEWLVKHLEGKTGNEFGRDNCFAHYEITSYKPKEVVDYKFQILDKHIGEREEDRSSEVAELQKIYIGLLQRYVELLRKKLMGK